MAPRAFWTQVSFDIMKFAQEHLETYESFKADYVVKYVSPIELPDANVEEGFLRITHEQFEEDYVEIFRVGTTYYVQPFQAGKSGEQAHHSTIDNAIAEAFGWLIGRSLAAAFLEQRGDKDDEGEFL